MKTSLNDIRNLAKDLELKRKEYQNTQNAEKCREYSRLHAEALKNKSKIQKNIASSKFVQVETFISRIRFDYIAISILFLVIASETFYLYKTGIISAPSYGKYAVKNLPDETKNNDIASSIDRLIQDVKSENANESLSKLFNTNNPDKIRSFITETDKINVQNVVYVKNEHCYYASALTNRDRTVTLKFDQLAGDCRISSIDIED
ncbi:MAG TPA: hypothetical protein DCZ94_12800 [Lentisphaeria bacterium]|nr:MAG: hypothetical protein A2X48_11010 [Lentisphaerae bacterium GWF2_49_21]HBC87826.1 hypothetical protein [Lentisphaeria bacterium]